MLQKAFIIIIGLIAYSAPGLANNYDGIDLATEKVTIFFDASWSPQDSGSLRYMARLMRAAEKLPAGIKLDIHCPESNVRFIFSGEQSNRAERLREQLKKRMASMAYHPGFKRLRTCLAWAVRQVRTVMPNFEVSSQSPHWYALQIDWNYQWGEYNELRIFGSALLRHYARGESVDVPLGLYLSRRSAKVAAEEFRGLGAKVKIIKMTYRKNAMLNTW